MQCSLGISNFREMELERLRPPCSGGTSSDLVADILFRFNNTELLHVRGSVVDTIVIGSDLLIKPGARQ